MSGLKSGKEFDFIIIGGGATGSGLWLFFYLSPPRSPPKVSSIGIALDAATRGLSVALIEMDDFGSGTSSKSTKLLHGGGQIVVISFHFCWFPFLFFSFLSKSIFSLEKAFRNLDYNQYQLVCEALKGFFLFPSSFPFLAF